MNSLTPSSAFSNPRLSYLTERTRGELNLETNHISAGAVRRRTIIINQERDHSLDSIHTSPDTHVTMKELFNQMVTPGPGSPEDLRASAPKISYKALSPSIDSQNTQQIARGTLVINNERPLNDALLKKTNTQGKEIIFDENLLILQKMKDFETMEVVFGTEDMKTIEDLQKTVLSNVKNKNLLALAKFLVERKEFSKSIRSSFISSLLTRNQHKIYEVTQFLHENGVLDEKKDLIINQAWKDGCYATLEYFDERQELGSIDDDLVVESVLNNHLHVVAFLERTNKISPSSVDKAFLAISRCDNSIHLSILQCLVNTGKFSKDSMNQAFINACKGFKSASYDCDGNCDYRGSDPERLISILQCLEETGTISDRTRNAQFLEAVSTGQKSPTSFFLKEGKLSQLTINQAISKATSSKDSDMIFHLKKEGAVSQQIKTNCIVS